MSVHRENSRQPMLDDQGRFIGDVKCVTCGFNLRGLAPDSQCPECGASVLATTQARGRKICREWAEPMFVSLGTSLLIPLLAIAVGTGAPRFMPPSLLATVFCLAILFAYYWGFWKSLAIAPWFDVDAAEVPGLAARRKFFRAMLIVFMLLEAVRGVCWLAHALRSIINLSWPQAMAQKVEGVAALLIPLFEWALLAYLVCVVQNFLGKRGRFFVTRGAAAVLIVFQSAALWQFIHPPPARVHPALAAAAARALGLSNPGPGMTNAECALLMCMAAVWFFKAYLGYKIIRGVWPEAANASG